MRSILFVAAIVATLTATTAWANPPAQARSTPAAPAQKPAASTSKPVAQNGGYRSYSRRGWNSGRSNSNWWRSRGTPDDNSTIPTPVNRNPKGRPYSPFPNFPKSM
ncbi:MAG TPA: hypothetical protein VMF30_13590 [Pirellulales bacterium]|nr:hypothetical protein [Pirellulales bacterium]